MEITITTTTKTQTYIDVQHTEVKGELYFICTEKVSKGFPIRNIIEITERRE